MQDEKKTEECDGKRHKQLRQFENYRQILILKSIQALIRAVWQCLYLWLILKLKSVEK